MDATKFNELIDGVKDMDENQIYRLLRFLESRVIIPCYYAREDIESAKDIKFTDESWGEFQAKFDSVNRKADVMYDEVWEMVQWVLDEMGIKSEESEKEGESEEEDKEGDE